MKKRIKKAKQAGFNVGIKNFDETNFFRKLDWRVKRIKKEKDNEIKKLSDENDNLNIDKSNLQHELDMSKIELSDAYSQRNEASRKNSVYIDKVNALKKENKLLLPYKDQFDLKLKQEKEPLQAEVKELTSENTNLKNENTKLKKKI